MRKTREQLVGELSAAQKDTQEWKQAVQTKENRDATLRKRFTAVLGRSNHIYSSFGTSPDPYSWEEIFFSIGTLAQDTSQKDFAERMDHLETRINQLEQPK